MTLVAREATPADVSALLGLMRQLAAFEGYPLAVTERDLLDRGLAARGRASSSRSSPSARPARCAATPCSTTCRSPTT